MAKNTFNDFSATAASNTDIAGIDIQGTAAVANFDNALRTLMAILRADLDNGTVFVTKAAGYTAVANDNNAFYEFTAAATLALTAAATLAADWHMTVFANGGAVTIDPNGAELINGAATMVVADGNAAYIICTGTAFKAIPIKPRTFAKGADVASATALTLGGDGNYFDITGTTTITSITTIGVGTIIKLHFDGILTLTHHATDLVLPGAANIITAAGDEAEFVEYAAGDWRCTNYQRAAGPGVYLNTPTSVSGTSVQYTGIPAGAKRVTINFLDLSTNGTSQLLLQLGTSGGIETTDYQATLSFITTSAFNVQTSLTTGFMVPVIEATANRNGRYVLELVNPSNNAWSVEGSVGDRVALVFGATNGYKALSGVLDRIRIVPENGTDAFDGGVVNISWEF